VATPGTAAGAGARWQLAAHVLFFALLLGTTALALSARRVPRPAVTAGLTAALAGWYALLVAGERRRPERWSLPGVACLGAGWVVWVGLVAQDEIYLILLAILYPQIGWRLRMPWSIAGLLILTLLWTGELAVGTHALGAPLLIAFGAGAISILITLYIEAVLGESQRRGRLLAELETTRNELVAAERLAGTIEERQRLAAEIHDTVAQGLAGALLHLESARLALSADDSEACRRLELALRSVRASLTEARGLTGTLQPAALSSDSLDATLAALTDQWSEEQGVGIELQVTGAPVAIRPEAAVTLVRATQESLANVAKHAGASAVSVTLSYLDGLVALDVHDDGRGFEPEAAARPHPAADGTGFGLAGLRRRVERQGGSVAIESAAGDGTTIAVSIPVAPS
jgi:signal transduction histidine kinase